MNAKAKVALLNWVQRGGIKVIDVPVTAYSDTAQTIEKYADHEIDFTDATLIWLANSYQQQQILTVDKTIFQPFVCKIINGFICWNGINVSCHSLLTPINDILKRLDIIKNAVAMEDEELITLSSCYLAFITSVRT